MDNPKELAGLTPDNYNYPLADVSHLSEKEKKDLLRRGMCIPKELHSDEEFEQWVTVFSEWNTFHCSNGHKSTEEERNFTHNFSQLVSKILIRYSMAHSPHMIKLIETYLVFRKEKMNKLLYSQIA